MVKYTPIRVPIPDIQVVERWTAVSPAQREWIYRGIVFLAGLLVKTMLVISFPALYGGDTVFHLRNHAHLLLSHQLPMLQILIYLSYKVTSAPLVFRMVMVAIGALSGTGFYMLCRRLTNQEAAFWAALFFVTNPFLDEVSIVPFQEMLMVGALCFALYCYFDERFLPAAMLFALACLTRQEAWLVGPVLIMDYSKRRNWRPGPTFNACAMFAIAPIFWVVVHLGLSSPGTYTLEIPQTPGRLVRWMYVAWVCIKQTPMPVLAFALTPVLVSYRNRVWQSRGILFFGFTLTLYLLALLFAAHGIGHPGIPNPELFISAREATLLVSLTLALAAFGMESSLNNPRWNRVTVWIAGLGVLLGVLQSFFLVGSQTSEPHTNLSYQVATYIEASATANDKLLIVARPFTPDDWNYFLQKAEQLQGKNGAEAANRVLRESDLSPMDLQRTAIQTSLPQNCFVSSADLATVNWLLIWNDAPLPDAVGRALKQFHQVREFKADGLTVTVWRKS